MLFWPKTPRQFAMRRASAEICKSASRLWSLPPSPALTPPNPGPLNQGVSEQYVTFFM